MARVCSFAYDEDQRSGVKAHAIVALLSSLISGFGESLQVCRYLGLQRSWSVESPVYDPHEGNPVKLMQDFVHPLHVMLLFVHAVWRVGWALLGWASLVCAV